MKQQDRLAKFLKTKRESAGLSQKEVSDKLGYSTPQFISNWERGLSAPPIPAIEVVANLYKIDPGDLFNLILEATVSQVAENMKRQFHRKKSG